MAGQIHRLVLCLLTFLVCAFAHQPVLTNAEACYWDLMLPDRVCLPPAPDKVRKPAEGADAERGQTKPAGGANGEGSGKEGLENGRDEYEWERPGGCVGRYCLYFNRGFASGQGIAVITTTANFEHVKLAGHLLLSQGGVSARPPDEPQPFHVSPVPAKGLGVIANATIPRGTRIMAYAPALLVHRSFLEDLEPGKQAALLAAAVDSLPVTTGDLVMDQMAHVPAEHRIAAILATNSFQIALGPSSSTTEPDNHHYANYPLVSRLNHDCRPDAAYHISPSTLVHTVTAAPARGKEIPRGQEITISYLDPFAPRAERQARTRDAWGFACTCSHCRMPAPQAAESDARLEAILRIEATLADLSPPHAEGENGGGDGMPVDVGLVDRLLALYRAERLGARAAGAYTLAALNLNLLGESKRAAKVARLAAEAATWEHGGDAPDAAAMRALAEDPVGHFTYRGRAGL